MDFSIYNNNNSSIESVSNNVYRELALLFHMMTNLTLPEAQRVS